MIQILYIGCNAIINTVMERLINRPGEWGGVVAADDETGINLFLQHEFDIVLLGNGLDEQSERKLKAVFTAQRPEVPIIDHYGGGSGLLYNEIRYALEQKAWKRSGGLHFNDPF